VSLDNPVPSALESQAMAAYRQGRLEEAAQGFAAARQAYLEASDAAKAAEMANDLSVTLLRCNRPQDALEAVRGTEQLFSQLEDRPRAAQAYGNLASALEACGDTAGAERAYRQAISLFGEIGDAENRARTLTAVSRLQLRRGHPLEAVITMQGALEDEPHLSRRQRLLRWLLRIPSKLQGGS
jgi:tetratricopeptide (TPR) repeat protein